MKADESTMKPPCDRPNERNILLRLSPHWRLALMLAAASPAIALAQAPSDTLRGRVVTDSGAAVPAAEITVTRAPDRLVQRTRSDSSGHWIIVFVEGTGDYLVHVSAPGFQSARKRVQRPPGGLLPATDLTLKPIVAQTLAP